MFPKLGGLKFRRIMSGWSRGLLAFCLLLFAFCCLPLAVFSQNKKELEDKRKKIIRDIRTTERMIQKTAQTREATYDRYLALKNQIESRENLIQNINDEILAADQSIARNNVVVESLTRDISKMQEEYGSTLRAAYRRKTLSNPLLYIFSAESLNQAFLRWLFLRKYDRFRKQQAEAIEFTRNMLAKRSQELEQTRIEKENLLVSLQGQKVTLSTESAEKNQLLQFLEKDEGRLKQDLQKKQTAHEALNQAIEQVIQEAVRKQVEEARRTPAPAPPKLAPTQPKPDTKPPPSTAKTEVPKPAAPVAQPKTNEPPTASETDTDNASVGFRQSKGRLPWPVEGGFIARGFGRQKHPTLKNIEITNNGIDIRTDEAAAVRAISDGVVAGVQFVPGHDYTVIIRHGNYYTVYSNLSETSLSKGDAVRAKQSIGRVSSNPITGASELHFELWHQKERLNPVGWIKK